MRPVLLLLFLGLPLVYSLNGGDPSDWTDHPYLVKVAATVEEDKHYGCTGVLISTHLVLTSSRCFEDFTDRSPEAVVMSIRGNGTTNWKRQAKGIKISGDFALLTIQPRKNDYNCLDAEVATEEIPRVAHLPFTLEMDKPLWSPPSVQDLMDKKCRVVGFETVDDEKYAISNDLLEIHVELEKDFEDIVAQVELGKGPCYEDYGMPLECQIDEQWMLVGLVQALMREPQEEDAQKPENDCDLISGMRFVFLGEKVHHLLKKNLPDILKIQKECFPDTDKDDSTEKDD